MSSNHVQSPPSRGPSEATAATSPALATRRHLSERQVQTVQRLLDAAFGELVEHGYDQLTVRRVARRAGVTPATAYTYFDSKEHVVAELFWRRYAHGAGAGGEDHTSGPLPARLAGVLGDFTMTVANETELSAACTVAILARSPEVQALRSRIGGELHRRLVAASDGALSRAQVQTLELATAGALLQVGTGHLSYEGLPAVLHDLIATVLGSTQEPSASSEPASEPAFESTPPPAPSHQHRGATR